MPAMVARTGINLRPDSAARAPVRVTHALLYLAATVASPGVCDACTALCRAAGFASSVAATHCCGSPEQATARPVADAGDGDQITAARCDGSCRCQLSARGPLSARPEDPAGLESPGLLPASPAATLDACVIERAAVAVSGGPPGPARPVRILYGVWRN